MTVNSLDFFKKSWLALEAVWADYDFASRSGIQKGKLPHPWFHSLEQKSCRLVRIVRERFIALVHLFLTGFGLLFFLLFLELNCGVETSSLPLSTWCFCGDWQITTEQTQFSLFLLFTLFSEWRLASTLHRASVPTKNFDHIRGKVEQIFRGAREGMKKNEFVWLFLFKCVCFSLFFVCPLVVFFVCWLRLFGWVCWWFVCWLLLAIWLVGWLAGSLLLADFLFLFFFICCLVGSLFFDWFGWFVGRVVLFWFWCCILCFLSNLFIAAGGRQERRTIQPLQTRNQKPTGTSQNTTSRNKKHHWNQKNHFPLVGVWRSKKQGECEGPTTATPMH